MIWEVFRKQHENADFTHCRDVHAPDKEMAKQFAVIQHGRRKPTEALWVAPQDNVASVSPGEDPGDPIGDGPAVTWTVFSQSRAGRYHTHCGEVSATDAADAKSEALEQFADDDPHSLWVVPEHHIGEITSDEVNFGGTTNKEYRFAQAYNVDPAAEEVKQSEDEQVEAARGRGDV